MTESVDGPSGQTELMTGQNEKGGLKGRLFMRYTKRSRDQRPFSTVTARRFWLKQLSSSQTATGRSLP